MRNTIYVVEFDGNKLLNGDFDFKEEALEWAEEHLTEKPIVKAIDLEIDEDGNSTVFDEEELFHYPVEDVEEVAAEEISDVEEDDVLKALSDFANSIDVKQDSPIEDEVAAEKWFTMADEADIDFEDEIFDEDLDVNSSARDVASELNATLNNWDLGLDEDINKEEIPEKHDEPVDNKDGKHIEEDVILFDPFGADFSECKPMEVCTDEHRADCADDFCQGPVDFLRELAAELGIADEVEISEKECADDSCEAKHEDEISCEDCKDEISEISDEVKDQEDIVPEEVKANEEPNVEVQVDQDGIEAPAEEISKCHVCPECGKEICECDKQKLDEAGNYTPRVALTAVNTKTGEVEREFAHYSLPINGPSDVKKFLAMVQADQDAFLKKLGPDWVEATPDNMNKYANWKKLLKDDLNSECGKEICECGNKELVEKNKVTHTTGDPAIGDAHFNGAFESGEGCCENLVEAENLIDDTEGKDNLINALKEETHPEEAQPEVDHVKAFNTALEIAKRSNKPVIYGYMGADHHGKNRYFEIPHVVCDDLAKCRQDVMNQYHPNGSILVAYPDKEFIEEGLILGEDLEILTEGPLGWLSKAAKTVAGGVKNAAGAIADTAKKGVQAVGNAVKNDLLGTDGTDLDKEFKKYQVKGFEGDTGSEAKETKTFTKFMDANNYAVEYSKQEGKRAYIYPSVDGTSFNRDILAKYEKGKISENHIKDMLANFAKAKQDTKDAKKAEDQKKKDDAKLAAAAGKSEEGKAEAAEKEKKEKAKAGIAAMAGMKPEEVTDEMISKFNELMKSFKPAATESLAEEIPNSELEDKMLFIEEQEEMSDLELAEKLEAAKKEKQAKKQLYDVLKDGGYVETVEAEDEGDAISQVAHPWLDDDNWTARPSEEDEEK